MTKYYPEVSSNPDFPRIEEKVLEFWKKEDVFQKSISEKPAKINGKNNEFVFYDGPPFANGLPHYGHLLTGFVKDIFARYQTMQGKRVERRFGWDCHGLPAEMGAEKELGISGRFEIEKYGIDKFNSACQTSVMKYTNEWEQYVTRQARWVDFKNSYKTMDKGYMESVLWAFKQLWDKGLVYESMRVMPYSWACETPLSNFETRMDNSYRERTDKAVTVAFELDSRPEGAPQADKYYLCAWTTTPWTLPSNLALAVNEKIEYGYVLKDGACYIMAKSSLKSYSKELGIEVVKDAILETNRLYLRPYTKDDLELLYGLHSTPEVGITTIDGVQTREQSAADLEEFISHQKERGYSQWAVFERGTDKFVGRAGLVSRQLDLSQPEQIEVRYAIHKEFWGKGYATELANACVEWAFKNSEVEKVVAAAGPKNFTSHKVLDKLGFKYIKSLIAREQDIVFYEVMREGFKSYGTINGSALAGLTYKPLFPYFKNIPELPPYSVPFIPGKTTPREFKILNADFVLEGDGTGVVHLAPGFGEDDFNACKEAGIQLVCPVDNAGKFTAEITDLDYTLAGEQGKLAITGRNVLETNDDIIKYLKATHAWLKTEQYKHNYPHCWRTDTPLIYKAVPSWYVEVTKFKDRMVELNNENINWIPNHIRDGQFGKWLENARDWSISRNRYWGSPIPVWKSDNPKSKDPIKAFGSINELEQFFNQKVEDLHRPFIDNLIRADDDEQPENPRYFYKRVSDVFDCWFESGSMPFAQVHYPFENKDWFENHFPADFIVEYVAQTRGWFYTLMVLSTAIFDRPPFLNCICHGVVLDDKGQKLSKRLNNYADPMEIFNKFGADAMRWVMISAPIMHGGELLIDKEGNMVRDAVRLVLKPVWNAYNFFTLYANADGLKANFSLDSRNLMDRYILSKCREAVENIGKAMDSYDTPAACREVEGFFEILNNWYIRRSKERFWKSEKDADKQTAYDTLYSVLHIMCRAFAPLLPLVTEEVFQGLTSLRGGEADVAIHTEESKVNKLDCHASLAMTNSIHLQNFPDVSSIPEEKQLISDMDRVRDICNAALAVRSSENIRVRQPLGLLTIVADHARNIASYKDIIEDEINVKNVNFADNVTDFADYKLKINFPILGKRLPTKVKDIIAASKQNQWKQVSGRIEISGEELLPEECSLLLEPKNKRGAQSLSSNDALVVLDLEITSDLKIEGIYRDLVRMIQQSRKEADLNIVDRISLNIETANDDIKQAIRQFNKDIMDQTLAVSVENGGASSHPHHFTQKLEGDDVIIGFKKVS